MNFSVRMFFDPHELMFLPLTCHRFIDAFSNHIISSVENAITNKIMVGALKLDSFLGSLPKKIDVDNVAAMNVTFVNDPLFKSSSVEFDIDGLFIPSHKTALPRNRLFGDTKFTPPLVSTFKNAMDFKNVNVDM